MLGYDGKRFEGAVMYSSFPNRLARRSIAAVILAIGLCLGEFSSAAEVPEPADPTTLRDAIIEFAKTYDFSVTGAEILGQEAPNWPANDQPPAVMLRRLLSNYGYITELRPGSGADSPPVHITIVGASTDRTSGGDQEKHAMPASIRRLAAERAASAALANPSALTRSLTSLAMGGQGRPAPAQSTAGKPPAPYSGLSGSAAPAATSASTSGPDMAALTQAARASVIGLVTSLQNACGQGSNCR